MALHGLIWDFSADRCQLAYCKNSRMHYDETRLRYKTQSVWGIFLSSKFATLLEGSVFSIHIIQKLATLESTED